MSMRGGGWVYARKWCKEGAVGRGGIIGAGVGGEGGTELTRIENDL